MNAKVQEVMEKVITSFETGDVVAGVARTAMSGYKSFPQSSWSPCNKFMCEIAGSSDCRGFNQWKKVGRSVKKGAKAARILVPCKYERIEIDENGEEVDRGGVYFKAIPVFRYEDTEGEEIEGHDVPDVEPAFIDVAQKWGIDVRYESSNEFLGCYYRHDNEIQMASHDEEVFWHELAHAAHHRFMGELAYSGLEREHKEIVAETVAAAIGFMYGKAVPAYHRDYVASYLGGNTSKAFHKCRNLVGEMVGCLDMIIGASEGASIMAA